MSAMPSDESSPSAAELLRERYAGRLPGSLGELTGPSYGTVQLPLHVAWSGLTRFDLDRPRLRMSMYRTVLAEGQCDDLVTLCAVCGGGRLRRGTSAGQRAVRRRVHRARRGTTWDEPHTYTDGPPLARTVSVQWQHPLGDVVTALAQAGLRIEFLHEHATTLFQRYPVLERTGPAEQPVFRFPEGHPRLPLMYSVRATKW